MDKGNTALVLNPFLDGMRAAGADVDLYYVKKLNIKPCGGTFHCWSTPSSKCGINDDMQEMLSRMKSAETWVFGIPVYVSMPGEMQNFINRLMPLLDAKIVIRDGRMHPHRRGDVRVKRLVLVSSSAYWELENFDELVSSVKRLAYVFKAEFVGPVLRPHADVLKAMMKDGRGGEDIVEAARDAGRQVVKKGSISKKTIQTVQRPLMTFKQFIEGFEVVT